MNVAFQTNGADTVKRALTFAGFLKVAPCAQDDRVFTGERAGWEAGASAPVRLSFVKPAATATAAAKNGAQNGVSSNDNGSATKKTWKLALDDDEDGGEDGNDSDLVDEDALLEISAPVKRASDAVSLLVLGFGRLRLLFCRSSGVVQALFSRTYHFGG